MTNQLMGNRLHDSGLPFVDQHFNRDISCSFKWKLELKTRLRISNAFAKVQFY